MRMFNILSNDAAGESNTAIQRGRAGQDIHGNRAIGRPDPARANDRPAPAVGPAVCVSLRYSEIVPETADIEQHYWDLLRQIPVTGGIGVLASLNSVLSEHRAGHRDIHKVLNARFLTSDLAAKIAAREVAGPVSSACSRASAACS